LASLADNAIDIAFVDTQLGDYTAHVAVTLPDFAQGREVLSKPYLTTDLAKVLSTASVSAPTLPPR
jgi:hypothetical protein